MFLLGTVGEWYPAAIKTVRDITKQEEDSNVFATDFSFKSKYKYQGLMTESQYQLAKENAANMNLLLSPDPA